MVPGQARKTDWTHLLLPQLGSKAGKLELIPANHTPHRGTGVLQQDGQRHPQMQLNVFKGSSAVQRCPAPWMGEDSSYMKCFHSINLGEGLQDCFCHTR